MNTARAKLWLVMLADQEQRVMDGLEVGRAMNRILKQLIAKQQKEKDDHVPMGTKTS